MSYTSAFTDVIEEIQSSHLALKYTGSARTVLYTCRKLIIFVTFIDYSVSDMADKSRKGHVLGYFPKSDKLSSLKFEHLVKDNGFINYPPRIGNNGDIDYGPDGLHNFFVIRVFSGNVSSVH